MIIIQARTNSSRLPNKILLPFYGEKTILDIILENLSELYTSSKIIIATSDSKDDDAIYYKYNNSYKIFRGDEKDVLDRYISAMELESLNSCIRICSDNPFIIPIEINKLLKITDFNTDYCSFLINGVPSIRSHCGYFAEYVSYNALKLVDIECKDIDIREHVTSYIYMSGKNNFKINWLLDYFDNSLIGEIRLTVDNIEDFKLAKLIYNKVMSDRISLDVIEITEYIYSNKEWLRIMKNNMNMNIK